MDSGRHIVPKPSESTIVGGNISICTASERDNDTIVQDEDLSIINKAEDPDIVTWDGRDDNKNPLNWSKRKKWTTTLILSAFSFISPISSSMLAPAIEEMSVYYNVQKAQAQMMLSSFVLAYAAGSLITGPLSELFGRVWVLQLWNIFYLAFNTACIGAHDVNMLIAFRFMAGLGASVTFTAGGGIISDIWRAKERGSAVAMYTLMPLVGPALGPIFGGLITHHIGWKYCFVIMSCANAVIVLLTLLFLCETYSPTILTRKARRLRKETGNPALYSIYEVSNESSWRYVIRAMVRPFRMLGTQPIIQVLAIFMGVLNGSMYLLLASFPLLWHGQYQEPIHIASLNYLSIALGLLIGSQFSAFLQDDIYRRCSTRYATVGKPEYRIPLMMPASVIAPLGLVFFGWAAASRWFWLLPNLGAMFFAIGTSIGFQGIQVYIIDAYHRYAASALGAAFVLRSVGGFAFPLFAQDLYEKLEFGVGASVVAAGLLVVGCPGTIILWVYGEKLRARSGRAGDDSMAEN